MEYTEETFKKHIIKFLKWLSLSFTVVALGYLLCICGAIGNIDDVSSAAVVVGSFIISGVMMLASLSIYNFACILEMMFKHIKLNWFDYNDDAIILD